MKNFHRKEKLQYLYDYYKLHFLILCIILYIIIYTTYGHCVKKNKVLYIAFPNVTIGEDLFQQLTDGYIASCNLSSKQNEVYTYQHLYISSTPSNQDSEYAYLSSTKILAAIDSQKLDILIMDQKALDLVCSKQYLTDLSLLSDYSSEMLESGKYGIELSNSDFFKDAGFSDSVYIGIVENSPHKEEAIKYIQYVFGHSSN